MLRALPALLVLACAASTPAPRPLAADWWVGRWVVDGERLAAEARRDLPPEARALGADLARAAAPEYTYEFSREAVLRVRPDQQTTLRYTVVAADDREARLATERGEWRLERAAGGLVVHDGGAPLPLKELR